MYKIHVSFDRTIVMRPEIEVMVARIPVETDVLVLGDTSHFIRSVQIIANPHDGQPVAHVRVK